jgi:chemotaxis protein MotB
MARKKKHEEHENLERWLVSYADFITLLFAFFVVMYSLSSVNEGKFRAMSDSIAAAFAPKPPASNIIALGPNVMTDKTFRPQVENLAKLKEALGKLEQEGKVHIFQNSRGTVVRIVDTVLYESGKADLFPQAVEVLRQIVGVIGPIPNPIRVEGYTDNIPIHTAVFPSNWELSSARAISIVKQFIQDGMEPLRLEAVGYGEYRPIDSNSSPEGQAKNRRVDIVILNPDASPPPVSNPFGQIKVGT